MLKQLTVPVLGLAVLAATAIPAAADKGRAYLVTPAPVYVQGQSTSQAVTTSQPKQYKRKFKPNLDFETKAVWQNLRPEWFD
jgi:hypothetical protein